MSVDLRKQVDEAFDALAARIEELGQTAASTEAVLYAKDKSEEWKRDATFEYELHYEVEYLERVKARIDERIKTRRALGDERHSEWESG